MEVRGSAPGRGAEASAPRVATMAGTVRPGAISGGGWSWKPPVRSPAARAPAEARPGSSGGRTARLRQAEELLEALRPEFGLPRAQVLDSLEEVRADLSGSLALVRSSMNALLGEVMQVKAELQRQAQPVQAAQADLDLSPVVAEIQAVRQVLVAEMRGGKAEPDLSPVVAEIQALRREVDLSPAIAEIRSSKADFGEVRAQLQALRDAPQAGLEQIARQVDRLASDLDALPKEIQKSREADFGEVRAQLQALRDAPQAGLEQIARQVDRLASDLDALPKKIQKIREADFGEVRAQLQALRDAPQAGLEQIARHVDRLASDLDALPKEIQKSREAEVLAELQLLRTQMDALLDATTDKFDALEGQGASTEPTGNVFLSLDLANDATSGVGESSIASAGSTCRIGMETSRVGQPQSCSASAYADEDVMDMDDLSVKIDCRQLDAALWELR